MIDLFFLFSVNTWNERIENKAEIPIVFEIFVSTL